MRSRFERAAEPFFAFKERLLGPLGFGDVTPVDVDGGLAGDWCDREGEDAIAAFELGLPDLGGA